MTDQEMREIVAGLVISTAELSRGLEETRKAQEETRRTLHEWIEAQARIREEERNVWERAEKEWEEIRASRRENERLTRRLSKQIGDIGNKFGDFTEGMALPSMEKILYGKFGMNVVLPGAKGRQDGDSLEIDVLAYDNGDRNEAIIVEVKSDLDREDIQQILNTIEAFPRFFPLLRDRTVYGIIAAVHIPANLRNEVSKKGLYLARISDDTFKLQAPPNFRPKAFNLNGGHGDKKTGAKPKPNRAKK